MRIPAAIARYFATVPNSSPRDHREANNQQAKLLVQAERNYWDKYFEKAWVEKRFEDCEYARDQLDDLDALEAL